MDYQRFVVFVTLVICSYFLSPSTCPAATEDTDGWDSTIAVGTSVTDGNSDTLMVNTTLRTDYKKDRNEAFAGTEYSYGEAETEAQRNEKNLDNGKAYAQYNRDLSESLYAYLRVDYYWDKIAEVDYRVIVSSGFGHYLFQDENNTIALEASPAWQAEKVDDMESDSFLLRMAERGEHKIGENGKIWHSVEYLPEIDDFETYLFNAELGAEAAMNETFSLRLVVQEKYDSDPAPGREKNDVSVNTGLVYKL